MGRSVGLPEGRVTFLFTDVEGSTRLLEEHPTAYGAAIARHHDLLAAGVEGCGGVVFETIGDAVYAAFSDPAAAVEAAAQAQLALRREDWGPLGEIRVRMGVHTGDVERRGAHYFGPALYRCARLMATAHGGQVVLSGDTAEVVRDALPDGVALLDLGSHRLKDLLEPERVFQLAGGGLRDAFPPLRSAGGRPNNLPSDVKTFVGRQEDLDRVRELLAAHAARVVTLTGPGGSGKTRLALKAAEALLEPFKDGVFLVELAPLADAELVAPTVAGVLGVQKTAGRAWVDSLVTHLAGKELLLVLDNFEHVLRAASDVAALVAAAPRVAVLSTSRVPLRIGGEHELHVGPLPLPAVSDGADTVFRSPAVQLFVERAREIRGDFALDEESAPVVAEICRRLDGLPLALELGAARMRLLSPRSMLERMDDRLGLLTGGAADLPLRQRTLRAAIAWSYDLLEEQERALLRRLAVFRGGCGLAAAERVCGGDVLSSLSLLAEHSLVVTRWNELGEPRFELLETIADFARERLVESGEADEVARRHAEHFAAHAEEVERRLHTDERLPWLRRLAEDRDNFRAALARSVERDDASVALRILGSLWLWWWTAFSEGLEWAERVLRLPSAAGRTPERARALFTAEICAAGAGDLAAARRYAEEAIELGRALGDDALVARAQGLGAGALAGLTTEAEAGGFEDAGGPDRLRTLTAEAVELARGTGDPWAGAWTTMICGLVSLLAGDPVAARPWAAQAREEFAELGDSWSRASASMALAFSLIQLGEPAAAEQALEGSVAALLRVGDLKMASGCLIAYGLVGRFGGRPDAAERHYREALDLCVRVGDPANGPVCLEGIAAALATRDPERAARLLGAARALFDAGAFPNVPGFEVFHAATSAAVEDALGADAAARQGARGASAARTLPLADLAAL